MSPCIIGALLVGYYNAGRLVYSGKVGTGFDDETLRRLGHRLAELETRTCPFAIGGLPRVVRTGSDRSNRVQAGASYLR